MMTIRERYQNDATFATLVNVLRHGLRQMQFTPSEVREAAILAVYLEEMENPRPRWFHVVERELLEADRDRYRATQSRIPPKGEGQP